MKTLLLSLFFAAWCYAQTVPVTVSFNLPSTLYLKDVEQSRFLQKAANALEGTVSTAIAATGTTLSVSGICPANNTAVLIDSEPMMVTGGAGTATCTVTRNSALSQAGTTAAAHAVGATVYELKYPNATAYFVQVGVAAFVVQCIGSLGAASSVTGSAQSAVASAQASLSALTVNVAQ